jgi:Tol biopolymer transport system component
MSMIGKTLAHYEITSQLGKGGMGEVFRAKDQKLGRDVAIKVLPEEFAKDADRVARFQREAKLLASLNHPNIAAIHGLEEADGINFLVLELVEGETLADQIKKGPIPIEEALKSALQIAEALEAAHEKGVIHRDLKPSNIKVTPEGKVKVLDFGLAKAYAGDREEVNLSNSPTLSDAATQQGVILGTAAYMSPEQARGEAVDKKADIWAFGVVLFEMLTGRDMFEGRTVSDTLAAVLMKEPDWKRLPVNLHPRIRLLLERCLEKEARNRYTGIGDARVDIQRVLTDPGGALVQQVEVVEPRTRLRTIAPWIAAAVVIGAIIAGVAVWKLRTPEPRRVMRFTCELPRDQQFGIFENPLLAVSPDGGQLVYSTKGGLYLRSIGELDSRLIPGTNETLTDPFFSPDGRWVGYWSTVTGQLKKIAISGGAPVVLADCQKPAGPVWGADDSIVYAQHWKGIMRISAKGGTPEVITETKGEMIAAPRILPDKKTVMFTLLTTSGCQIAVRSLKSGERKLLFPGDSAQYVPTGHIVYALGNNLMAVPFELDRLEAAGVPVPIVQGVFRSSALFAPQYAVSDSGTLAYVPGTTRANAPNPCTLVWVDRKGKEEPLAATSNDYLSPKISPDGTQIALNVNSSGNRDIWIWDLVRETMIRLILDKSGEYAPLWTPDGKRILFNSDRDGRYGIYWKAADGTGTVQLLGSGSVGAIYPGSWSKDGKTLALIAFIGSGNFDIGALSMEGDYKPRPLLQEKYVEWQPNISPDGRWMAYASDESGQNEVYVRPFPEVNKERWQLSTSGGDSPLWAPNGRELFYRCSDSVMAVAVQTAPSFKPGKPEVLFQGKYVPASINDGHPWDISLDGKQFLMMKRPQSTGEESGTENPHKINIIVNWFEELKQQVPVK